MTAEPTTIPRTEDEKVAAQIPVVLGTVTKALRVLSMRESRKWKLGLVNAVGGASGGLARMDLGKTGDLGPLADAAADRILELVIAYDVDGSLGGRDWIEEHATDAQVYAVFRTVLSLSFPFVTDLRTALAELRALGLMDLLSSGAKEATEPSPSESSTNGASPDGASTSTPALLTSS